jgi:general secretion pathway protein G
MLLKNFHLIIMLTILRNNVEIKKIKELYLKKTILLLSALIIFIFISNCFDVNKSRIEYTKGDIKIISETIKDFYESEKIFPENLDELIQNKWVNEDRKDFKDIWGENYIYIKDDKLKSFQIISYGVDRKKGGSGYNEDIIENNIIK